MAIPENPLKNWQVRREEIQYLGHDLQRPECILTEPNGMVWAADARGGAVKLNHQGEQEVISGLMMDDFGMTNAPDSSFVNLHSPIHIRHSQKIISVISPLWAHCPTGYVLTPTGILSLRIGGPITSKK